MDLYNGKPSLYTEILKLILFCRNFHLFQGVLPGLLCYLTLFASYPVIPPQKQTKFIFHCNGLKTLLI